MKTLILGDFHTQLRRGESLYNRLVHLYREQPDLLVQIGDFGFGLTGEGTHDWSSKSHPCVFIDGNHENHESLRHLEQGELVHGCWEYLPRGTVRNGILFVGGARTIMGDRSRPHSKLEQVTSREADSILKSLEGADFHTVISHDAPSDFDLSEYCTLSGDLQRTDTTARFLSEILERFEPSRWYFGHYHHRKVGYDKGCRWRCVAEVGTGDHAFVDL